MAAASPYGNYSQNRFTFGQAQPKSSDTQQGAFAQPPTQQYTRQQPSAQYNQAAANQFGSSQAGGDYSAYQQPKFRKTGEIGAAVMQPWYNQNTGETTYASGGNYEPIGDGWARGRSPTTVNPGIPQVGQNTAGGNDLVVRDPSGTQRQIDELKQRGTWDDPRNAKARQRLEQELQDIKDAPAGYFKTPDGRFEPNYGVGLFANEPKRGGAYSPDAKAPESWRTGDAGFAVVDRYTNPSTGESMWTPGSNYRPPDGSGFVRGGQPSMDVGASPVPNPTTSAEKEIWRSGNDYYSPPVPGNNGFRWGSARPAQQPAVPDMSALLTQAGLPPQTSSQIGGSVGYSPGMQFSFAPPPSAVPFQSASMGFDGVLSETPNYVQRDAFVNNINNSLGDFWMANRTNQQAPPPQFNFADLWSRAGDMAANGWQNPLAGLFG